MAILRLPTWFYRQYDSDFSRDVPGEGYGGWDSAILPLASEHTAFVLMHAWDCGTREQFPGWHHAVEYIPRADAICLEVLPGLLSAIRAAEMPLYHVVAPTANPYYQALPGYQRAASLPLPPPEQLEPVAGDPVSVELGRFRHDHVFPGAHNQADIDRGFAVMSFPRGAEPLDSEPVAENGRQLAAVCRAAGINHLIYIGFAINWCLLMSPGGMLEMSRYGLICSAIREAVTAVENKESARAELHKEEGLWRTSIAFGFVYQAHDIVQALSNLQTAAKATIS
ncbi:MAG: hypothetical protein ACYC6L_05910 [Anaerolineae bacterium]